MKDDIIVQWLMNGIEANSLMMSPWLLKVHSVCMVSNHWFRRIHDVQVLLQVLYINKVGCWNVDVDVASMRQNPVLHECDVEYFILYV